MKGDPAIRKYFNRYAEREADLADEIGESFAAGLVIPSYGEGALLSEVLASIPPCPRGDVLVIVVLNARQDSPDAIHAANARTRQLLLGETKASTVLSQGARLLDHPRGRLLLIDRAREGCFLPTRQGVGLARKIGADLAAALSVRGALLSPWIHCTDADARLPSDYFEKTDGTGRDDTAALVHPFRHSANPKIAAGRAALEYEASLRYYVLGLRHAGSKYAYHTIGSTLSIRTDAYLRVRGFPRRVAAEDFYLLNKLAKVGGIESLSGAPIELSSRESLRVPFGTGRAIRDAMAQEEGAPRSVYDPAVFDALRAWIRALDAVAAGSDRRGPRASIADQSLTGAVFDAEALEACLDEMGAFEAVHRAQIQRRDPRDLRRHLHDHFDAFRSLKLIHALRDRAHPSLPLREALARAPFVDFDVDASPLTLCRELEILERPILAR